MSSDRAKCLHTRLCTAYEFQTLKGAWRLRLRVLEGRSYWSSSQVLYEIAVVGKARI